MNKNNTITISWSPKLEEDLRKFHGIDLKNEISRYFKHREKTARKKIIFKAVK